MTFQALPATGRHRGGHSWLFELLAGLRSRQVRLNGSRVVIVGDFYGRHAA